MAYMSSRQLAGSRGGFPALIPLISGGISLAKKISGALKPAAKVGGAAATAITLAGAFPGTPPGGMMKRPGVKGTVQRILPGGESGYYRRRRMNVANPKALRRAIRRTDGFIKLAKRTLKGTGYTVKRTGSPMAKKKVGARR